MDHRNLKKLRETGNILKMELQSHLACLAGYLRVRLSFDKNQVNKLEFGVGPSLRKAGFITSDFSLQTDYPFDLRVGLPFPDESLNLIYSEHVLEHFVFADFAMLLRECYRTLKAGGTISLAIPDPTPFIQAYSQPDSSFDHQTNCTYDFGLTFKSKIDYLNYIFYMGDTHKYLNDRDSILQHLSDAGFKGARLRAFDPALDQKSREHVSIYAEATK